MQCCRRKVKILSQDATAKAKKLFSTLSKLDRDLQPMAPEFEKLVRVESSCICLLI